MNAISKLATTALVFVSMQSFATVGGKQYIEFMGYDARDQKVYLLKHYEDARGRLPQLYYFILSSNNNPLIAVKSVYKKSSSNDLNDVEYYFSDEAHFNQQVAQIKQRLQPLSPLKDEQLKIRSLQQQQYVGADWYEPNKKAKQYHYSYSVETAELASSQQQAVSYQPGLKIDQAYLIPAQNKAVVSIQYLGLAEEGGYTVDDAVILMPKTATPKI